jgi:hypothetical protein
MKRRIAAIFFGGIFVSVFLISLYGGSSSVYAQESSKGVYLKNNIHVQEDRRNEYRGSYSNWTSPGKGHIIIPVNTVVSKGDFRKGFSIIIKNTGKTILMEVDNKAIGMDDDQYWKLITSEEPAAIDSLPLVDQKGIKDGKAYVGMTKEGVRIALGYPAPHKTPSLENNVWYYWTNRFKSIAVEFDETGKVKSVGGKQETPK